MLSATHLLHGALPSALCCPQLNIQPCGIVTTKIELRQCACAVGLVFKNRGLFSVRNYVGPVSLALASFALSCYVLWDSTRNVQTTELKKKDVGRTLLFDEPSFGSSGYDTGVPAVI